MRRATVSTQLGEEGAVLPIVLFGVIVISLLVSSALLTASSEMALSRAHQEGVRSLFEADAALETFVAANDLSPNGARGAYSTSGSSPSGKGYEIGVTPLSRGEVEVDSLDIATRRELLSIAVAPSNGRGRLVGALVETVRTAPAFHSSIDAAATVGGRVDLQPGAMIAALETGRCPTDRPPLALRFGAGPITGEGAGGLTGGIEQDTVAGSPLVERILAGSTLSSISEGASIYFGEAYGEPPFSTLSRPDHSAVNPAYRWGCPSALVYGCPPGGVAEGPLIVIDAGSGEVELNGGHGEGVLVVRGAGARMRGDFRFSGVVIVEGRLRLADSAEIFGAAVVGGDLEAGSGSYGERGPAVVFDRCSIEAAERAFTTARLEAAPPTLNSPTIGGYEIVR